MATPYGLFELKHFFSGGYRTSTGMDVAATTIKQRLRELVKEEDVAHPLSDQKLAELLSRRASRSRGGRWRSTNSRGTGHRALVGEAPSMSADRGSSDPQQHAPTQRSNLGAIVAIVVMLLLIAVLEYATAASAARCPFRRSRRCCCCTAACTTSDHLRRVRLR